ncbi:hypothetical protein ACIBG7_30235 [Nonomuraea sp. NPDC050328]|uniref:hypothetical protein n=1 Tax=Nonomuraea sp. NPDC050328 TaxID=3364361 RepID=UPI0037BA2C8E
MPHLLRHLDDLLDIEYGKLGLLGAALDPWRCPSGYHYEAPVRLEAWDADPGPPTSWLPARQGTFVADTGVIQPASTLESPGRPFLIGPPLFEYGFAAYYRPVPDDEAESWLLRFWPIRDVFDPAVHARPLPYFYRGVHGQSVDLSEADLAPRPSGVAPPVPVSVAADWVTSRDTPGGRPRLRPGALLPEAVYDLSPAAREDWLRREADADRIAMALCRPGDHVYTVAADTHSLPPGVARRLWRWETDYLDGAPPPAVDPTFTAGRQVHVTDPFTRRILVSAVVTVLRTDPDRARYDGAFYLVRDAEPHEAARVLCAEAYWAEDPAHRAALNALARDKIAQAWAAREVSGGGS